MSSKNRSFAANRAIVTSAAIIAEMQERRIAALSKLALELAEIDREIDEAAKDLRVEINLAETAKLGTDLAKTLKSEFLKRKVDAGALSSRLHDACEARGVSLKTDGKAMSDAAVSRIVCEMIRA